ncbi:hypothetical protein HXX76_001574 [Chlamydomonas incerta]|uniref:BTB domain-containing protein n=1 Tax=Chlamydomonas incerta TaxID=51695 RepID=A0A836B1T0_CHLIN|nr:hypothetical protein HXX76_001574 [Chlamydomonas incerta]|eukprot:KAG2444833.1 hypothetical protein HXX76_001574 [Chlamydomonas incerta]
MPYSGTGKYPHYAAYDPCTDLNYLLGPGTGLYSHNVRTGQVAVLLAPPALQQLGMRTARGMAADGKGCLYLAGDWAAPPAAAPPAAAAAGAGGAGGAAAPAAAELIPGHELYPSNGGKQAGLLRVFLPGVWGRTAADAALVALLPPEAGPAAGVAIHHGHTGQKLYLAAEGGVYELVDGAVQLRRLVAGERAPAYTAIAATASGDLLVLHENPERIRGDDYDDASRRHRGWLSRLKMGLQHGPRLSTLTEVKSLALYPYTMHVWRPQVCALPHGWVAVLEPDADCRELQLFRWPGGAALLAPSVPTVLVPILSAAALAERRAALAAALGALLPAGCGSGRPAGAAAAAAEQSDAGSSGGGGGGGGDEGSVWDSHPDVVVRVGGEDFTLHRMILAARSSVLRTLLASVGSTSSGGVVPLPDTFTAPVFRHVVDYIYTGAADDWDADTAIAIADLAHFLDMPCLRVTAQRHLLHCMRPAAFATALRWASGWPLAVARAGGERGSLAEELRGWYVEHQQEVLAQAPRSLAELAQSDGGQLAVQLLQAVADAAAARAAGSGAGAGWALGLGRAGCSRVGVCSGQREAEG